MPQAAEARRLMEAGGHGGKLLLVNEQCEGGTRRAYGPAQASQQT